jgi:hypothetical protein
MLNNDCDPCIGQIITLLPPSVVVTPIAVVPVAVVHITKVKECVAA